MMSKVARDPGPMRTAAKLVLDLLPREVEGRVPARKSSRPQGGRKAAEGPGTGMRPRGRD